MTGRLHEAVDFGLSSGDLLGEPGQFLGPLVRHDLGRDTRHYDVMGYWSGSRGRQARRVDPGPIYAAGRAAGKSDDEIWADYDEARNA